MISFHTGLDKRSDILCDVESTPRTSFDLLLMPQ